MNLKICIITLALCSLLTFVKCTDTAEVDLDQAEPEPVPVEPPHPPPHPHGEIPNLFKEIDTNEDGVLSTEEIEGYFKKQGADGIPPGLMENEDKDNDGFVSFDEFSGPKGKDEL